MAITDSEPWRRVMAALNAPGNEAMPGELGDFTTPARMLVISGIAAVIGALGAVIALALLALIAFFTNLFFYGRLSTVTVSPAGTALGPWVVLAPVVGALIIGCIARFGSERIRGHGIPEAIEAILINGSRVEPRVALLKPISAAISIGSGGPFGAEGPVIMTGGAVGSLIAQFVHLTSAERKTLLVAGAAAGMAAVFGTPVAAVLLGVELLLFEWKPRSLIPVALASATAAALRPALLGMAPLFPTPPHPAFIGPEGLLGCLLVGLVAGAASALLTYGVYGAEDAFHRLPIHWMWWPAIGGLVVGLGGLVFPPALGVGYDVIEVLLRGDATPQLILGILVVKSIIWVVSLGSGTSGGVLAPLLMLGGALGGLEAAVLPNEGAGFWPLISMAAILGGTMRSPFTGIVFALELTHDVNALLPLLVAVVTAHGFTVLTLRRSILTEKVSRRGYHLSREYAIDPLEILFVREIMRTEVLALPADLGRENLEGHLRQHPDQRGQRLYPVVDGDGRIVGVVTRARVQAWADEPAVTGDDERLGQIVQATPVLAHPDEPLRVVAQRMAQTGLTRFPVVERGDPRRLVGMVSLTDLLKGRARNLDAEQRRQRILGPRLVFPRRARQEQAERV